MKKNKCLKLKQILIMSKVIKRNLLNHVYFYCAAEKKI